MVEVMVMQLRSPRVGSHTPTRPGNDETGVGSPTTRAMTGAAWLPVSPIGHEDATNPAMQVAARITHRKTRHTNPRLQADEVGRPARARCSPRVEFVNRGGIKSALQSPCAPPPAAALCHPPSLLSEVIACMSSPRHCAAFPLAIPFPLGQVLWGKGHKVIMVSLCTLPRGFLHHVLDVRLMYKPSNLRRREGSKCMSCNRLLLCMHFRGTGQLGGRHSRHEGISLPRFLRRTLQRRLLHRSLVSL